MNIRGGGGVIASRNIQLFGLTVCLVTFSFMIFKSLYHLMSYRILFINSFLNGVSN